MIDIVNSVKTLAQDTESVFLILFIVLLVVIVKFLRSGFLYFFNRKDGVFTSFLKDQTECIRGIKDEIIKLREAIQDNNGQMSQVLNVLNSNSRKINEIQQKVGN